jgi:hypothetical protein
MNNCMRCSSSDGKEVLMAMLADSLLQCSDKLVFVNLIVSCIIQGAMELSFQDRILLINERLFYLSNVFLLVSLRRVTVSSFEQPVVSDLATSKECFVGAMISTAGRWGDFLRRVFFYIAGI